MLNVLNIVATQVLVKDEVNVISYFQDLLYLIWQSKNNPYTPTHTHTYIVCGSVRDFSFFKYNPQ